MVQKSTVVVVSPATLQPLFEVPCATPADIDAAVAKAEQGFASWRKVPVAERVAILQKFCTLFEQKKAQVGETIVSQMGRPVRYAAGEVGGVLERANYMISVAEESLADEVIESTDAVHRFLRKEPLGPVFIIAAWNYPYLTMVNNVVPALLAGNAVLLKQSPQTPKCADLFVETFHQAGVPEQVVQVMHTDDNGADYLVRHQGIQYVSFTGSVAVGKTIRQSIGNAERLIGLGMELGGKDPAYVLADADLDFAAENIVDGAFFNSGQCCCSIERCYVHSDVYESFLQKAVAIAQNYKLGDPSDPETTMGPMAHVRFADKVRAQIAEAVVKGAKLLVQTDRYFPNDKPGTTYVGPQIITDVTHDMTVMQEETFGPVLVVIPVHSDKEAVELMNDSTYGLTASIWTQDADKALEIGNQIECGTWFMNRCDYIDPALAWVGAKDSGLGFSMSKHGFDQFIRPKSYHLRLKQ
ncbi:aldehyde dehydrogenase [Zychaea mexicana]|uniref:aldehyde dehydrogenase n=1 Tax=Zychaea mexicana TaxID=64656 RepID=UPI0022FE4331|nr:aldehyde dehydrogenase [Zychaea mexicana]KAI9492961.1 aldehyde dehydrogenase [Zychaea mexicana]